MESNESVIVTGVVGFVTTAVAWFLGGRQKAQNSTTDTIANGADKIVDTSNKLLDTLQMMLQEERQHRAKCEAGIEELRKEVNAIKLVCKSDCFK